MNLKFGFVTAASLLAVAAFAAVESGLKPGTQPSPFQVVDVTGPNKGKELCYRCQFGGSPVVAAFVKNDVTKATQLISDLQKISIPLVFLPQGAKAEDIASYNINPDAQNTVILWRASRVRSNFVDVNTAKIAEVAKAADAMLQ
jgi:hypothetical protein